MLKLCYFPVYPVRWSTLFVNKCVASIVDIKGRRIQSDLVVRVTNGPESSRVTRIGEIQK